MEYKRLLYNAIKCNYCNDKIGSANRYDYVSCKCGKSAVDGGLEYQHLTGDNFTNLAVFDNGNHAIRIKHLKWGANFDKDMNLLPKTIYKTIKNMDTDHIQAIIDDKYCRDPFYLEVFTEELKRRLKSVKL